MIKAIKGETYSRSASVKDGIVTINQVSQLKDGNHYFPVKIDMTDVDGDEALIHAAYNILIQIIRPRALKNHNSTELNEAKVYKPGDYPATKGGGGISKDEANTRFLESLGIDRKRAEYLVSHPDELQGLIGEVTKKTNNK